MGWPQPAGLEFLLMFPLPRALLDLASLLPSRLPTGGDGSVSQLRPDTRVLEAFCRNSSADECCSSRRASRTSSALVLFQDDVNLNCVKILIHVGAMELDENKGSSPWKGGVYKSTIL